MFMLTVVRVFPVKNLPHYSDADDVSLALVGVAGT